MTNIVKKWSNVAVSYVGKLEDGTVFDSTEKHWGEPLKFEVWAGQMIKGFDDWVVGMKIWESKTIKMDPKNAYGEYNDELKQKIQKKDLVSFTNAWIKLEIGEKLPTQYGNFEIIEADENSITIDQNHELAWKKLIFEVEIIKIK
jgi:peptidylprolyl isomerase